MCLTKLPKWYVVLILVALIFSVACEDKSSSQSSTDTEKKIDLPMAEAPDFNADSAYFFVEKQVSFGPRVPNSKGHYQCGEYLIATLERFADEVIVQPLQIKAHNGTMLSGRNIFAAFNPEATKRVMLAAHWDTRPVADQDAERQDEPILGANDGASGVGVLLEIARLLAQSEAQPQVGIDIALFDLEDYGVSEVQDSYCLGSQYWGDNKHKPKYAAFYGILLDMVGARDAKFAKEGFSMQNAPLVVNKVWETAQKIGYGEFFINQTSPPIIDDHYYINKKTKIPFIDIIEYEPSNDNYFGSYWHTHDDNMDIIDKRTLKAVGQTVLQVIYNE
ncbi:MAG: M28 family peptidase [Bernardetiaceae bacterium]|nr:M28 family peptidase [Bernardetiaceae bacterium]